MVCRAIVSEIAAVPVFTYLPKEVKIVVRRQNNGLWHWFLRDFFGGTAVTGRFAFKTRSLAIQSAKLARADYIREINERIQIRKGLRKP